MGSDFIHLHVHSEYSLLDGYATTKAIAERAVELGMDSIALTDHGVMYGAMEFYAAAKKAKADAKKAEARAVKKAAKKKGKEGEK